MKSWFPNNFLNMQLQRGLELINAILNLVRTKLAEWTQFFFTGLRANNRFKVEVDKFI